MERLLNITGIVSLALMLISNIIYSQSTFASEAFLVSGLGLGLVMLATIFYSDLSLRSKKLVKVKVRAKH